MATSVDPYKFLNITLNPVDGSITRHSIHPTTPANSTDPSATVWSKDIPLNTNNHTWLRLYLPTNLPSNNRLPVIIYFHGGGFAFDTADRSLFHQFCEYTATELNALVASLNYRLTPDHRLPAAYDDASESLNLIRTSQDPWITSHADLSRCLLMGESAGANIAYHTGLRATAYAEELKPLQIRGLVLIQPYFGGSKRTGSETRLENDPVVPLSASDVMWELSLPVGSGLDHEYCNPTAGGGLEGIERMRELGWRVVVTAVDGDPLFDREVEFVELLEEKGVGVSGIYRVGYYHLVYLTDRALAREMFDVVVKEMIQNE